MKILALDTATELCSVALHHNGHVLSQEVMAVNRHAEALFPMIKQLLAEAGLRLADLDAIAFGSGPGSFTGVRIACGIAQGLALGADLGVIPVNTLEALALQSQQQNVITCLDARMGEVYYAAYHLEYQLEHCIRIESVIAPCLISPQKASMLTPLEQHTWYGCGTGFNTYPIMQANLSFLPEILYPHAREIAHCASLNHTPVTPEQALPYYLRNKVALTVVERQQLSTRPS